VTGDEKKYLESKFDRNREPYIEEPADKDSVIAWIRLVDKEITFKLDV